MTSLQLKICLAGHYGYKVPALPNHLWMDIIKLVTRAKRAQRLKDEEDARQYGIERLENEVYQGQDDIARRIGRYIEVYDTEYPVLVWDEVFGQEMLYDCVRQIEKRGERIQRRLRWIGEPSSDVWVSVYDNPPRHKLKIAFYHEENPPNLPRHRLPLD